MPKDLTISLMNILLTWAIRWVNVLETIFSWNRKICFFCLFFFLNKTMQKPYLNFHFKFHDFFPWNNKDMKILSFVFFSLRTLNSLVKFLFNHSFKEINYIDVMIFKIFSLHRKKPELCNICEQDMLKSNSFSKNKNFRNHFFQPFLNIYRPWLFNSYYITIYFIMHGSTW